MKVRAELSYGEAAPPQEVTFEIDYVAELYDAMNDEVGKLPEETNGIPVQKWKKAVIVIVRD
ncbi:hypothetical protein G6L37_07590 [Agrobacterium rubi]|nr:hypothetical protein [Agrobacterium rubi]NTF25231.1 hypothetical protein [Agrobacterium rubi]